MKKPRMTLAVLTATLALTGCATSDHRISDIMKIPPANIKLLSEQARAYENSHKKEVVATSQNYLTGKETQNILARYEHLPMQNIELYMPLPSSPVRAVGEQENLVLAPRRLDTTGVLNPYLDEVKSVEESMPEKAERRRFVLGPADADTERGRDNQLSDLCGILGIDTYTTKGNGNSTKGNGNFLIEIDEVTHLGENFREEKDYNIKLTFGEESFREMKKRIDWMYVLEGVESAGLGFLAAGTSGIVGSPAEHAVVGLWGYVEGLEAPKGTFMSDSRVNVGKLEERVADVYTVFEQTKELRADSLLVVPYSTQEEQGTAYVFLRSPLKVESGKNSVTITTNQKGANHLKMLLLRALRVGTRVWCGENDTKRIVEKGGDPCPPAFGGGQTGGPGGTGGASGGGQGGSSGGG